MLKKIIAALSLLGLFCSIGVMIGLAGSLETDVIDVEKYMIKTCICLVVLILSVIGVNYTEKDESEYENL